MPSPEKSCLRTRGFSVPPDVIDELPIAAVAVFAGLYGLFIGSFLNVCIWRLPRGGSVVTPRSACPRCGAPIPWPHNIPVLSWVLLRGRAACCGAPISGRYPAVEAFSAAAAAACVLAFGPGVEAFAVFLFLAILVVLFFTDFDLRLLPDAVTLPGIAAGLLLSFVRPAPGPLSAFAAAGIGFLLLLALAAVWRRLRGVEAVGGGDIKMLALMGAFLGISGLFVALLIASVLGAAVGCGMAAAYAWSRTGPMSRRGRCAAVPPSSLALALFCRGMRRKAVPFGCFLAVGGAVSAFSGTALAGWYFKTLGL